jgi:hypothetical protein
VATISGVDADVRVVQDRPEPRIFRSNRPWDPTHQYATLTEPYNTRSRNQHFLSLLTQETRLQAHERARIRSPLLQQSRLPASRSIRRCGRHWNRELGATPRWYDHRPWDLLWPVSLRSVRSDVACGLSQSSSPRRTKHAAPASD